MKLQVYKIIKLIFLLAGLFFIGCSSSEYDSERYEINYVDKTIKADTIKTFVYDDKIKDDKINENKDTYVYIIQIGAFIVKSNFDKFYDKARQDLGSGVYYEEQNGLYKIRIGKFGNRAEAILQLEKIKGMGYTDAFIVTKKN